jgi:hypothetical protein
VAGFASTASGDASSWRNISISLIEAVRLPNPVSPVGFEKRTRRRNWAMSVIIVFPNGTDWFKANWVFQQLAQDGTWAPCFQSEIIFARPCSLGCLASTRNSRLALARALREPKLANPVLALRASSPDRGRPPSLCWCPRLLPDPILVVARVCHSKTMVSKYK